MYQSSHWPPLRQHTSLPHVHSLHTPTAPPSMSSPPPPAVDSANVVLFPLTFHCDHSFPFPLSASDDAERPHGESLDRATAQRLNAGHWDPPPPVSPYSEREKKNDQKKKETGKQTSVSLFRMEIGKNRPDVEFCLIHTAEEKGRNREKQKMGQSPKVREKARNGGK